VTAPGRQAAHILKAWVCQDEAALRHEFEEGLRFCASRPFAGLDEEHVELLQTVVLHLQDSPAILRTQHLDPMIRLCLRLLMHIADQGKNLLGKSHTTRYSL
jgi:hypothetical protein